MGVCSTYIFEMRRREQLHTMIVSDPMCINLGVELYPRLMWVDKGYLTTKSV